MTVSVLTFAAVAVLGVGMVHAARTPVPEVDHIGATAQWSPVQELTLAAPPSYVDDPFLTPAESLVAGDRFYHQELSRIEADLAADLAGILTRVMDTLDLSPTERLAVIGVT